MESGNKKHRYDYSGMKGVTETEKWGRSVARERYGSLDFATKAPPAPQDRSEPQRLGDSNNLRGPGWQNDHANDWVRGKGESAEGKPGFKNSQGGK